MGLFNRLLKLYPLYGEATPHEDFFTEIIAHLFDTSNDTLYAWIESLNLFGAQHYTHAEVSTQVAFGALEHAGSNRPDILIKLYDEHHCDWIIIESKIDSGESPGQLKRYAEILDAQRDIRGKALLYVTYHYDPKDERTILSDIPGTKVQFKQLRWHHLYHFLKKRPRNALLDEILAFMEEHGMAQETQFTPIHAITLVNFSDALQMMDATMSDQVCSRFMEVVGGNIKKSPTDRLRWLRDDGYWIISVLNQNWDCGLGYDLGYDTAVGYPYVGFWIETFPHAPRREEIIEAMKQICVDHKWEGYELEENETESYIYKGVGLQHFLASEDHVAAIESFFLERVEEFALLKREYPDLPWESVFQDSAVMEEE
jgi:hypothetical protein